MTDQLSRCDHVSDLIPLPYPAGTGLSPKPLPYPAGLIPLLTRLLFPKLRKRSGRLGGKGTPGSARTAILNFLAAAEPHELTTLLQLFLEPLAPIFTGGGQMGPQHTQVSLCT